MKKIIGLTLLIFSFATLASEENEYQRGIYSDTEIEKMYLGSYLKVSYQLDIDANDKYVVMGDCRLKIVTPFNVDSKISKGKTLSITEISLNPFYVYTMGRATRELYGYALKYNDLTAQEQKRVQDLYKVRNVEPLRIAKEEGRYKFRVVTENNIAFNLACTNIQTVRDLAESLGNSAVLYEKLFIRKEL